LVGAVFLETAVTEAEKMELIKEASGTGSGPEPLGGEDWAAVYIVEATSTISIYDPDPIKLMVLKAVRVVSGLNAATVLLEAVT